MEQTWQTQGAESWKLTLPCTRAEAAAIEADAEGFADLDPPPVVMTSEPDPAFPDRWQLDLYLEQAPGAALIERVSRMVPSAAGQPPRIERIEDADWVTLSQAYLEPIRAGRFHVHTAAHADRVPAGTVPFLIEAGRAFGTGHHETTSGCLALLDRLETGGARFGRIADIGTGTGLLAFAARALWPEATILAADIDPVAIEVARRNMAANAIPEAAITLLAAPGTDHPAIAAATPFDLVIANILAGPLIDLAADFARAVVPGGPVLLAGLLQGQEASVLAAYEAAGFRPHDRLQQGQWPVLALVHGP